MRSPVEGYLVSASEATPGGQVSRVQRAFVRCAPHAEVCAPVGGVVSAVVMVQTPKWPRAPVVVVTGDDGSRHFLGRLGGVYVDVGQAVPEGATLGRARRGGREGAVVSWEARFPAAEVQRQWGRWLRTALEVARAAPDISRAARAGVSAAGGTVVEEASAWRELLQAMRDGWKGSA